jgi:hypothetical protein
MKLAGYDEDDDEEEAEEEEAEENPRGQKFNANIYQILLDKIPPMRARTAKFKERPEELEALCKAVRQVHNSFDILLMHTTSR